MQEIVGAAFWLKPISTSRAEVASGPSAPESIPVDELDRRVLEVLQEQGVDPEDYCAKPIDIFLQPYSPRIDLIVGFKPAVEDFKLPLFPNHPPVTYLKIVPVLDRLENCGKRRAYRDCYADIGLAVDRALVTGQLPNPQAA